MASSSSSAWRPSHGLPRNLECSLRNGQGWADLVWALYVQVPVSAEKAESEERTESCDSKEKPRVEKQEESEKTEPSPEPLVKGEESLWLGQTRCPCAGSTLSCGWDFCGAVAPRSGIDLWRRKVVQLKSRGAQGVHPRSLGCAGTPDGWASPLVGGSGARTLLGSFASPHRSGKPEYCKVL